MGTASGRPASGLPHDAMDITSCTGSTAGPRSCPTWSSCVTGITGWCMKAGGNWSRRRRGGWYQSRRQWRLPGPGSRT